MNEEKIKRLVADHQLRLRTQDKALMSSLLESAQQTANAQMQIPLNEQTAPIIFKTVYDAIRQLGDVKWLLQGYEPRTHEISIELLMEENSVEFKQLDRYRIMRNDLTYRGFKITVDHAQEIRAFWKEHGSNLLAKLKKEVT